MSSPPPAPTRHITTTSADTGLSSIWISEAIPIKPTYEGAPTGRGRIWIQEGIPGNNDPAGEIDGGKLKQNAVVREDGVATSIVDIPPGKSSPIHVTDSIDYLVVINGTVTLELTDGSFNDIPTGDIIVQRGTSHAWHNRTNEWARMLAVIVPAKPISLANGVTLKGERF